MADDLRTFCSGIADAIRTKKNTTDTINAQKFAEEILTIESGGGDGAVIEKGPIAVPNTGTVEKVYVNTNLSDEEVEGLLSQLTYNSNGEYIVVAADTMVLLCLGKDEMYFIADQNYNVIWCNEAFFNGVGSEFGVTHSGWQDFTNPIEINSEVVSEDGIGTQNELLTTLFSTTETFEKITKTLSGTYDGSSIVANSNPIDISALIDEKKIPLSIKVPDVSIIGDYVGTTVPNSGTVDKLYLNTNLSIEEVKSLLSKINFSRDKEYILYCSNFDLYIQPIDGVTYIKNANNSFWNSNEGWLDPNWKTLYIENTVENTTGTYPVGTQNELLSSLFSITPFEKATKTLSGTYDGKSIEVTKNGTVDVEALIDEQKIPLSINVNVGEKKSIAIDSANGTIPVRVYPDCESLSNEDYTLNTDIEPITIYVSEPKTFNVSSTLAIMGSFVIYPRSITNAQCLAIEIGSGVYLYIIKLTDDNASIKIMTDVS